MKNIAAGGCLFISTHSICKRRCLKITPKATTFGLVRNWKFNEKWVNHKFTWTYLNFPSSQPGAAELLQLVLLCLILFDVGKSVHKCAHQVLEKKQVDLSESRQPVENTDEPEMKGLLLPSGSQTYTVTFDLFHVMNHSRPHVLSALPCRHCLLFQQGIFSCLLLQ